MNLLFFLVDIKDRLKKAVNIFDIKIRDIFSRINTRDFFVWTYTIDTSIVIVKKKVHLLLGLEDKKIEDRREDRAIKNKPEKGKKTVTINYWSILSLRIGKRVRKVFLEDFRKQRTKINKKRIESYIESIFKRIKEIYRELLFLINKYKEINLTDIIRDKSRDEKVLFFYSALDMANNGDIEIYQNKPFGDIILRAVR